MTTRRKRTVVLISGRGSNMAALIQAAKETGYPAEIVGVISDQADAAGLKAAQALGLPTQTVLKGDHGSRETSRRGNRRRTRDVRC